VHIFSAWSPRPPFKPWHDKKTGKTFLRGTEAKCIHYYFYFILEDLGLCYLRVPTWAPFRLQFYFNGHHYLASLLQKKGLSPAPEWILFLLSDAASYITGQVIVADSGQVMVR
jgi:hypothetical protein